MSSGIEQWTNRERPTMNVSCRSNMKERPLRGPLQHFQYHSHRFVPGASNNIRVRIHSDPILARNR